MWQWAVCIGGMVICVLTMLRSWSVQRQEWDEVSQKLANNQALIASKKSIKLQSGDLQDWGWRPRVGDLSALSAQFMADAEQAGLTVSQWQIVRSTSLDTKSGASGETLIKRAGFSVQVQGTYASIKEWMGQLLRMQPWLAVNKLQWQLSDVGSGMLDAHIDWVIYVDE